MSYDGSENTNLSAFLDNLTGDSSLFIPLFGKRLDLLFVECSKSFSELEVSLVVIGGVPFLEGWDISVGDSLSGRTLQLEWPQGYLSLLYSSNYQLFVLSEYRWAVEISELFSNIFTSLIKNNFLSCWMEG